MQLSIYFISCVLLPAFSGVAICLPYKPTNSEWLKTDASIQSLQELCSHDFALNISSKSTQNAILLVWKPPKHPNICRELELTVHSSLSRAKQFKSRILPYELSVLQQIYLGCTTSEHLFVHQFIQNILRFTLIAMIEPTGQYCNTSSTIEVAFATENPANSSSVLLLYPRWRFIDGFLFILVVLLWAVAVGLFTHKWRTLRIVRNGGETFKKTRPKNIDQIHVCHDVNKTVIYKNYGSRSRMSICLEERQQRIAHLQQLYSEMEPDPDEEVVDFCGFRHMIANVNIPPPLDRHLTLDAIKTNSGETSMRFNNRNASSETDLCVPSDVAVDCRRESILLNSLSAATGEQSEDKNSTSAPNNKSSVTSSSRRPPQLQHSISDGELNVQEVRTPKTRPTIRLLRRVSQALFKTEQPQQNSPADDLPYTTCV